MQAYDLIMVIVLAMATIFGAIKGFAWQVASIASVIVSYVVAYRFRFQLAEMIQAAPPWNQFLAMLILYVGTSFVIWVGFRLLSGMIDRVRLKEFDRHMGAGFGFLKGLIYCLLITMFAMSLLGEQQQRAICQSRSGYYIATALDKGVGILPKEIHDVVGPYLANLDDQLNSGGASDTSTGDASSPWQDPGLGEFFEQGIQQTVTETIRSATNPGSSNFSANPPPAAAWGSSPPAYQPSANQPSYPSIPQGNFGAQGNSGAQVSSGGFGQGQYSGGGLPEYPAGGYPPNNLRSSQGSAWPQANQPQGSVPQQAGRPGVYDPRR